MKLLTKIISFLKNLLRYEHTENKKDTHPTKNGIDFERDINRTRNTRENNQLLDKEIERGGSSSSNLKQGGQTEIQTEGRRDLDGEVWSFHEVWNNNALAEQETKPEPRDFLRGSDLGKPMSDVWLKMKGEPYTNPPNDRSLRKFEAGNIWEWIIKLILQRAGIYISTQEDVEYQYAGLLKTTGHPDFLAGGTIDKEKAIQSIEELPLPPVFKRTSEKVIEYLSEKYPNGLEEIVLEIKSTSGNFFEVIEKSGKALKIHRLQLYNYLKSMGKRKGAIIYVSRDDCRILTIPVIHPNEQTETEYREYIEQMTKYYQSDTMPPLEQPIMWDEDMQRIKKNSMLGWSPYLTKLYGFKDQKEFDDKYTPLQSAFTRVITRIKKGDNLTKSNLEYIDKMKELGFDPYEIAKKSTE